MDISDSHLGNRLLGRAQLAIPVGNKLSCRPSHNLEAFNNTQQPQRCFAALNSEEKTSNHETPITMLLNVLKLLALTQIMLPLATRSPQPS